MVPGNQGYTSASMGTVTLSGNLVTIAGALLQRGQTLTLSYASAAPASPGDAVFYAEEQSGGGAILTSLAVIAASHGPAGAFAADVACHLASA
jgi:hypothetical protein